MITYGNVHVAEYGGQVKRGVIAVCLIGRAGDSGVVLHDALDECEVVEVDGSTESNGWVDPMSLLIRIFVPWQKELLHIVLRGRRSKNNDSANGRLERRMIFIMSTHRHKVLIRQKRRTKLKQLCIITACNGYKV